MACICPANPENTGVKGNVAGSVVKKLIIVPIYKADGTRNYIDSSDTINIK